jgi:hypothetical protein
MSSSSLLRKSHIATASRESFRPIHSRTFRECAQRFVPNTGYLPCHKTRNFRKHDCRVGKQVCNRLGVCPATLLSSQEGLEAVILRCQIGAITIFHEALADRIWEQPADYGFRPSSRAHHDTLMS